jgi:hypothetical protein
MPCVHKPTYNNSSTLFLVQLFPQILQLLLEFFPGVLGVQDHDFLIWPRRSRVTPNSVHQVLLHCLQLGTTLLLNLLRELA